MQVSLDVSMNFLNKRHPESVRFYGLLGLLPGGGADQDFETIWGKGWQDHASLLLRYSLIITQNLQQKTMRYTLYPFMIKYAEDRL